MIISPVGIDSLQGLDKGAAAQNSQAASAPQEAGAFGEMLSEAINGTISTLGRAEAVSIQALQGEADTREVVDAVMSAEQALQTAIAVRDKLVTAYLEVSRMAI